MRTTSSLICFILYRHGLYMYDNQACILNTDWELRIMNALPILQWQYFFEVVAMYGIYFSLYNDANLF
jgi:hypothetical protein